MELYCLRHGYAGKRLTDPVKDTQRQLTEPGKKEVVQVAKSLKKLKIKFNYIFSSPWPRAFQTAKIIGAEYKITKKIEQYIELKPDGNKEFLYMKLKNLNVDSIILIVGHEPYLSNMISDIISKNNGMDRSHNGKGINIVLKKAGLSKINITSTVPKFKGELSWLLTPKILKKLS